MKLNQNNLHEISKKISCPNFERQQLKSGIVHIGVGGFHRSHQAYYINKLLEKYRLFDWGICGIGLRESDRRMQNVLRKQDCLYTLITQHPDGLDDYEVIASIHEYILALDSPDLVIDKMAQPETKIVSLTITEGGYNFNPNTGEFNFENEDIQADLLNPKIPKTVFGYITEALRKRRTKALPPFTILSCDNIQHNGDMARKMFLDFADRQDAELAKWIESNVTFPNTMVDRITPVTTNEASNKLKKKHNVVDEWCVICEPFTQWVIEDKFCNGRPPLERLGVQFVSDVSPYEKMKIRLLNAGHSVIGITGALYGLPTIDACMEDDVFRDFMRQFMDEEVTPILGKIEGIDIEEYKDTLEERFANPNLKDNVSRICAESSAKLPKFLIPTLQDNLERNGSIKYSTFLIAAWCFYNDKRVDRNGKPLEIIDELEDQLHRKAKETQKNDIAFLNQNQIFGDLINNRRFLEEYRSAIKSLYEMKDLKDLMKQL